MEVLAALLLVALIIPTAMKGISIAVSLASDTVRRQTAVGLAETRLSELIIGRQWQSGTQTGDFGDKHPGYQWQLAVEDRAEAGLSQLNVEVFWEQRGYRRNIILSTLIYVSNK